MKVRLGVSACLLGQKVRYDGGDKREPCVAEVLAREAELIPVCPEVELGLGVPREPVGFIEKDGQRRLTGVESGKDLTEAMTLFAENRCAELEKMGLAGFVFKTRSPSCGLTGVPIGGRGLFARVFTRRNPQLPVAEEEELRNPSALEAFLKKVSA